MPTVNALEKKTLRHKAKRYLIECLKRGEITAGQKVPTVREISADLGVSTTVAMEALREMRGEGWFKKGEGRRNIVTKNAKNIFLPTIPLKEMFSEENKSTGSIVFVDFFWQIPSLT